MRGRGDAERGIAGPLGVVADCGKTAEIGALALGLEDDVGKVRRRATGLEDGVVGRVGGTL